MKQRVTWVGKGLLVLAVTAVASAALAGKKVGAKPLVVPASAVKRAEWVVAPAAAPGFVMETHDGALALARSAEAPDVLLAYGAETGVVGPIALPAKTRWSGTSGRGVVLAATDDGTLYRADSVAAAMKAGLAKVKQVEGARSWDAGGGVVIAAAGARAAVSSDGGVSFREHDFGAPVEAVFARGDGVVVAVPQGSWAWVSNDAGKTWRAPPAELAPSLQKPVVCDAPAAAVSSRDQPGARPPGATCLQPEAPRFVRDGDRIAAFASLRRGAGGCWNDDCETPYTCLQGALASDGKTWVAPGDAPPLGQATAGPFEAQDGAMVGASLSVARAPAPGGKRATDESLSCLAAPRKYFAVRDSGGTMAGPRRSSRCRGVACLRVGPMPSGDGRHVFLADAVCDGQRCQRPATRLSVAGGHRFTLSRAPCGPGWLTSSRGAAFLQCAGAAKGTTAVFLGDSRGGWYAQDDFPVVPGLRLDVAEDGTMLAVSCLPGLACRAFVRAPAPLERHVPWREVSLATALGYRVVSAGRALAILPASQRQAAELSIGMSGRASKPEYDGRSYDAWAPDASGPPLFEAAAHDCLADAVARLGPITGVLTVSVELDAAGTPRAVQVEDAPDARVHDCLAERIRKLPYQKPPGAVVSTRRVGFEASDLRYALWLLGGDAPVRLADGLDASAGLLDVEVVGRNVDIVLGESVDDARRGRLAADGGLVAAE